MYSKQEASQLKQQFWTAFGKYMLPVLSAEDETINWINYRTGEKNIFFRMNADNKKASVAIDITHKNEDTQALYFEQFKKLKPLLHEALVEEWKWELHVRNENKNYSSRIYTELENISIFKKEDWASLISFFKPRIIALDAFWSTAKYHFEAIK